MVVKGPQWNRENFQIVAHRGDRIAAPENTIPAFQAAEAQGVRFQELDVIATRDGRLPVVHDDVLGKIFKMPGNKVDTRRVREMNFDEVQTARLNVAGNDAEVNKMLGAGANYRTPPEFHKINIPTLEQVIDACPKTHFFVELKTYDKEVGVGPKGSKNNNLEQRVADLIRRKNLYNRVTVISFSPLSLWKIKRIDGTIKTGLDFELPRFMVGKSSLVRMYIKVMQKFAKVDSVHPCYEETTQAMVDAAHEAGMPIIPWVYHDNFEQERERFPALFEMGVDGLMTNHIKGLQDAVREYGKQT